MENKDDTEMPKLVGTNFVKMFREYLISLIQNNEMKEIDVVRDAFNKKNVKPDTTKKYLKEFNEMSMIYTDKNEILRVND